jgi:hypothetical protein
MRDGAVTKGITVAAAQRRFRLSVAGLSPQA